jgi:hypothetical protein
MTRVVRHGAGLLVQQLLLLPEALLLLVDLLLTVVQPLLKATLGRLAILHLQQDALVIHVAHLGLSRGGERQGKRQYSGQGRKGASKRHVNGS